MSDHSVRWEKEIVRVGDYIAEVEVEIICTEDEWSPYISVEDARRLDEVRQALASGDLERATKLAKVYRLVPVAA